jgi:GT2 family glycosyltransferase
MENCPKVFVIILNYNGKDVLKKCLLSVFKNDYPNFEIVLVDNNSSDASFQAAKDDFSKVHFIKNEENLGFSAGNNIGIRFALERMADYILLLNNDVEVEKDFLSRLINVAEKSPKIGILTPLIFNGNTRQIWFSGGKISWFRMKSFNEKVAPTADFYESPFVTGCAMLVKKEVFKKIGLLDEDYFLYWEDADFSLRAGKAGFKKIVVTSSWVYHFEKSEKNKENKIYWLVISGLIFFKKNTPPYLSPWITLYLCLRKLKNCADIAIGKNKLAPVVRRAYKDFKNAKF